MQYNPLTKKTKPLFLKIGQFPGEVLFKEA